MTPELWEEWRKNLRWMEALVRQRGWDLTPLKIDPPDPAAVARIEAEHGLKVPPQLRELLTNYSARVRFGWWMPSHLMPEEEPGEFPLPYAGGLRDAIWDAGHISEYAIPNFLGWRKLLAHREDSEEPNRPEMWENQFPIADLNNGDMLTIDISSPEEPCPVRYFSHELEGLHGRALAPDFIAFVTEYSRLGCAGVEHDGWFGLVEELDDNRHYLSSTGPGARRWFDWLKDGPRKNP